MSRHQNDTRNKSAVRWHLTPTNLTLLSAQRVYGRILPAIYAPQVYSFISPSQCLQNIFYDHHWLIRALLTWPQYRVLRHMSCLLYCCILFTFIVYLLFVVLQRSHTVHGLRSLMSFWKRVYFQKRKRNCGLESWLRVIWILIRCHTLCKERVKILTMHSSTSGKAWWQIAVEKWQSLSSFRYANRFSRRHQVRNACRYSNADWLNRNKFLRKPFSEAICRHADGATWIVTRPQYSGHFYWFNYRQ